MRKWLKRYDSEGIAGLQDRSSRPHRLHRPTPLWRQRLTGKAIAAEVGVSEATVSRILRRLGLNKLSALEPAEPVRRYEREKPGELIHLDIKKLRQNRLRRASVAKMASPLQLAQTSWQYRIKTAHQQTWLG